MASNFREVVKLVKAEDTVMHRLLKARILTRTAFTILFFFLLLTASTGREVLMIIYVYIGLWSVSEENTGRSNE